jgi:biopolymer transport protein ExbD/DNA-directed RNA polymerase subunit RPC12/RpoP
LTEPAFSFTCPACQAQITGAAALAGRRVRCPECGELVQAATTEIPDSGSQAAGSRTPGTRTSSKAERPGQGTVYLSEDDLPTGETVMLEAIPTPPPPSSRSVEVKELVSEVLDSSSRGRSGTRGQPPSGFGADLEEDEPRPEGIAEPKKKLEDTEMDMTPMVDVTFLLLIFFMVTASFTLQKSLEIPKLSPDEASTTVVEQEPEEQSDFVTVQVDEFNTYHVSTVDWEEEAPSEQDLHIHLRRARDGDSTGTVPSKLKVEAHGEAFHEKVVAALDAGTATGFEEVLLATIEDE